MLSLMRFPCCYVLVTFVFVVFHVGRGVIGQTYRGADNPFESELHRPANTHEEMAGIVAVLCSRFSAASLLYGFRFPLSPPRLQVGGNGRRRGGIGWPGISCFGRARRHQWTASRYVGAGQVSFELTENFK
jgi:hypothetical protein